MRNTSTLYEGAIVSVDSANGIYRYLLESRGRIAYVGNVLPALPPGCRRVKLGRQALLPAFADTHLHFSSWALFHSLPLLHHVRSLPEMLQVITQAATAERQKRGKKILTKPLLAFGASAHCLAEGRMPTRADLDAALPDRPLMVFKYDGHTSICNSALISRLPEPIRQLRGYNGDSGEMNQEAYFAATDWATKSVSPLALIRNMLDGYDTLAKHGIGLIHTVEGIGYPNDIDVDLARIIARGLCSPLQTRVWFQTMDSALVLKRKLPRIGGCFATALDGCFGSQDAALLEPYSNNPSSRGILYNEQAKVTDFCIEANRAGLQIQIHAIGDAAFRQAVTAIAAALADHPRVDHRHSIIHACLVDQADLQKAADLGICIAAQSVFMDWPQEPDAFLRNLLGDRADRLGRLASMRRLGMRVSLGSDAPCTLPNAIESLHAACNHPNQSESVTVADALRMLTIDAAWMGFDEADYGSLEPGKIANLAILSGNPHELAISQLNTLKVEQLLLAGQPYRRAGGILPTVLRGLWGRRKV